MRIRVLTLAVVAAMLVGACGGGGGDKEASTTTVPAGPGATQAVTGATTPTGLQIGPAPWPPEYAHLQERLDAAGIPALRVEGTVMDLHAFLLISVHGKPVTVPSLIGVNGKEEFGRIVGPGFVSPLHTHDSTGLIHVHSPTERTYRVGHIFDVWGVRFTDKCIGGYCADATNRLRLFIDGKEHTGDPRQAALAPQQVITVVFGSEAETPSSIPDKFPGT